MDRLFAMQVFVRVAECGSFSRAAQSLDVANATVTTCVRNLERHLNVMLINRDTRRLRLTEAGQTYLERVRVLLDGVARTEEDLRAQVSELRGWLHIETTISLGHVLLCPRLPEFAKRYPDITAVVTLTNHPHNVIERAIDVAIRVGHVEDGDLVARPLHDCRYLVCCAPSVAGTLPAHPGQLNPRQCIGHLENDRSSILPWSLENAEEKVHIQPDGPLHINSSYDVLEAARAGMGAAYVLDVLAQGHLANGSLVRVYPEWTSAVKTLYVVMPKSRVGSAKVKALSDFLFETIGAQNLPCTRQSVGVKARGRK